VKYKENDELVKKLDFHFRNKTKWNCELNQPYQVTVKTRQGQYRKKSMIGGEVFIPSSCYMGKKAGVIVVFTPAQPASDFAYVEIPLKECLGVLRDFPLKLDVLLDDIGDDSLLTNDGMQDKKLAKNREAELATNDTWGTW
jgi:hypothetical protein